MVLLEVLRFLKKSLALTSLHVQNMQCLLSICFCSPLGLISCSFPQDPGAGSAFPPPPLIGQVLDPSVLVLLIQIAPPVPLGWATEEHYVLRTPCCPVPLHMNTHSSGLGAALLLSAHLSSSGLILAFSLKLALPV